jgi:hypothetical protein
MRLDLGDLTTSKNAATRLAAADRHQKSGTCANVRLPHVVIVRASGLLPMLYRPAELAEDLGVSIRLVREWLRRDLPHQRDERGHFWIDGRKVATWVDTARRSRPTSKLADDEAYCLPCHRPVKLLNPTRTQRGKQIVLHGCCPHCGTSVHRGIQNDQSV